MHSHLEMTAYDMAGYIERLANHRAADASSDPFQRHPEESGDNSGPSSPAP